MTSCHLSCLYPLVQSKHFRLLPMIPFFSLLSLIPQHHCLHPALSPFLKSSQHPSSSHSSSCSASHAILCDPAQPSSMRILKPSPSLPFTPALIAPSSSSSSSSSSLAPDPLTPQRVDFLSNAASTMCSLLGHAVACCSHQQLIKVPSLLESQLSD